jgi:hypothetical protein
MCDGDLGHLSRWKRRMILLRCHEALLYNVAGCRSSRSALASIAAFEALDAVEVGIDD